jgi:hypothetical protein
MLSLKSPLVHFLSVNSEIELVEIVSKFDLPARVSVMIRFINRSFPARTRSALMKGYSFSKASSSGFDVSIAIEV